MTDAEYERIRTEANSLDLERIRKLITKRMWCHEAEDLCSKEMGISLSVAISYVDRAAREGAIVLAYGLVEPA